MELPKIGKQCSEIHCKQLDFLPFNCECGQVFCSEHFNSHVLSCESKIGKEQDVVLGREDKLIKDLNKCSQFGCEETSIVPLICEKCQKHFCIKHRHIVSCEPEDPSVAAKCREKYAESVQQFNKVKEAVDLQIEKTISQAKQKSKNKALANKVQLMKIKNKAVGSRSIPVPDRLYFTIHFFKNDTKVAKAVFVSKTWTLGRAIDAIANECGLQNNNNKPNEKKLRIFKKDTCRIIPGDLSSILSELICNDMLQDGEDLVINYVDDHCQEI